MASRDINALRVTSKIDMPAIARRWMAECEEAGLDVLIYCTLRSMQEQARLWRVGRARRIIDDKVAWLRTIPSRAWVADMLEQAGPQSGSTILTNALPSDSAHNYGLAFDAVPLVHGKAAWADGESYRRMGEIAQHVGLEWGGSWRSFQDFVHFQADDWRSHIESMVIRT